MLPHNHTWRLKFKPVILTRIKSSLMIISWLSKHVGVILSVLMCDIWINVLLQTSALVGPKHIVNWNAQWNNEILENLFCVKPRRTIVTDRQTDAQTWQTWQSSFANSANAPKYRSHTHTHTHTHTHGEVKWIQFFLERLQMATCNSVILGTYIYSLAQLWLAEGLPMQPAITGQPECCFCPSSETVLKIKE
jgi:hypothetical protein